MGPKGSQVVNRPRKITLGEMREMGIPGLLVYCSDYKCSHSGKISADRWPDHVRLSELEPLFTCQACGTKGAELRPDFNWARPRQATSSDRQAWRDMHNKETAPARGENWGPQLR